MHSIAERNISASLVFGHTAQLPNCFCRERLMRTASSAQKKIKLCTLRICVNADFIVYMCAPLCVCVCLYLCMCCMRVCLPVSCLFFSLLRPCTVNIHIYCTALESKCVCVCVKRKWQNEACEKNVQTSAVCQSRRRRRRQRCRLPFGSSLCVCVRA